MPAEILSIKGFLMRKASQARKESERLAKLSIQLGKRRLDTDAMHVATESTKERHKAEQLDIRIARYVKLERAQAGPVVLGRG